MTKTKSYETPTPCHSTLQFEMKSNKISNGAINLEFYMSVKIAYKVYND